MRSLMGLITTNYSSEGFGTLTAQRPAASLPFGGRYRLIDFPLSNMINSGIQTVGLITPHMYRSLLDHIGEGKEWNLARKQGGLFILPGSVYGVKSAHGRFLIRDLNQNRPFLERGNCEHVLICDSSKVYNIDFTDVEREHEESGRNITLIYKKGLYLNNNHELYIDLGSRNRVSDILPEPNKEGNCFIGAFIIELDLLLKILDWYEDLGYLDLLDVMSERLNDFNIGAYQYEGYVGSVSDLSSYMSVSQDLLREDVRKVLFNMDKPIFTKVQDTAPAKYSDTADVSASLVANGCIVEGIVENSILFRDVHVGKGSVIKNCVLMQHCEIGDNVILENIVCDKYVTIKSGVQLSASYGSPIAISKKEMI